jgi:predicted methyltransferase
MALQDAYTALKPGGVFGIVQHEARENVPDDWADGSRGYLKKSFVIEQVEKAGFEFVAENDVNTNDKDQPTADDVVWRLPPSLRGSRDDPEQRAAMEAIGESNRMTLKFIRPE